MYCPKCIEKGKDIKTKVIDSRMQSSLIIHRRRSCSDCGYRFTTWESIMNMDSRESLSTIMKKRLSKIKEQAQEIVTIIERKLK